MDENTELLIEEVRNTIRRCFAKTPFATLLDDPATLLSNQGKMLRSRLLIRVGSVTELSREIMIPAAAAVELLHTASLLHDDIIDNGIIRRNAPAYWQKNGTAGAVLLGDLILLYAMRLLAPLNNQQLSNALLDFAGEVGEAEVEQEIIRRGQPQNAEECLSTARHKTGPLFAFMGFTAAGNNTSLCEKLTEAGYLIGTAYQVADDMLDAYGQSEESDKSLLRDSSRDKKTAADAFREAGIDPAETIQALLDDAAALLTDYPTVQSALQEYLETDLQPALRACLKNVLVKRNNLR